MAQDKFYYKMIEHLELQGATQISILINPTSNIKQVLDAGIKAIEIKQELNEYIADNKPTD